jgi:two-component system OmpR family response regulator
VPVWESPIFSLFGKRSNGLELVKTLRSNGINTPLLLLSFGWIDDRVESLESGADDYLSKPFAFSELMARLRALGRRLPMSS